jgi:hypothetical protein
VTALRYDLRRLMSYRPVLNFAPSILLAAIALRVSPTIAAEPDPLLNGLQWLDDLETEVWGEDGDGGGEFVDADSQKLLSLRFKILNKRLRKAETQGWGLKTQVRLRFTRQEFKSIDEIDLDIDKFETVGLMPKFMLHFPITDSWSFVPDAEFGWTHEIQENRDIFSAASAMAFRWEKEYPHVRPHFVPLIKYGGTYDSDLQITEDFLQVSGELGAYLPMLDLKVKNDRVLRTRFHLKGTYYIKNIEFIEAGQPVGIDKSYEVGLRIGFDPRYRIWKIKVPAGLKLSYLWGPSFRGLKVSFGG